MLHGQVQVAGELGHLAVNVNQALGEFVGVAGGVADAFDARYFGHVFDEQGEVGGFAAAAHRAAIGVHVLAQQRHFLHALRGQAGDFGEHVVKRAAELFAARVGHDAVAAIFGAAFHDGDKGRGPFHAGGRQMVEFFDFGKADVYLRRVLAAALGQQIGQAVQGLRAEDDIDIRRALDDGLALLAGHAAAHADERAFVFEVLDAAQVREDFFLRLLAHGAGVEDDQIGLLRVVGGLVAFGGGQHIGHLGRVVFVHLAAKGLDEDFAGHGESFRGKFDGSGQRQLLEKEQIQGI